MRIAEQREEPASRRDGAAAPALGSLEASADAYLCFGRAFLALRSDAQYAALAGPLLGELAQRLPALGLDVADTLGAAAHALARLDAAAARREYAALFDTAPAAVPLNVGFYLDGDEPGKAAREAGAVLARYGLAPSRAFRERADHLSLLLACTALLCLGASEHGADGRDAERDAMLRDARALQSELVLPALPALVQRCRSAAAERGASALFPSLAAALLLVARRPIAPWCRNGHPVSAARDR